MAKGENVANVLFFLWNTFASCFTLCRRPANDYKLFVMASNRIDDKDRDKRKPFLIYIFLTFSSGASLKTEEEQEDTTNGTNCFVFKKK